jgi:hypothetical protein
MFSLFRHKVEKPYLNIDYNSAPTIPNGARGVAWHKPAGSDEVVLRPQQLRLLPLVQGQSYEWFRLNNPEHNFADAKVLDALVTALFLRNGQISEVAVDEFLGNFSGQIFFLNTAFDTNAGECHAFLNWRTHLRALRYVCPTTNPINHDVNCCACVIEK